MSHDERDYYEPEIEEREDCHCCYGTGRIDAETCDLCDGTGFEPPVCPKCRRRYADVGRDTCTECSMMYDGLL